MLCKIGYHGTHQERADSILHEGFQLNNDVRSDPGDLGRAIYLWPAKWRAFLMDDAVLRVAVDIGSFKKIASQQALFDIMESLRKAFGCTIRGKGGSNIQKERFEAAWAWRKHFLSQGYKGLLVRGWDVSAAKRSRFQIVIYDLKTVQKIELLEGGIA